MSKSRRDKFEDQLRALQSDINHLSHKLSVPAVHSIGAHSASETQVVHQKKSPKGDIVVQSKNSSSMKNHERSVPASTIKTNDASDVGQRHPTIMNELSNQNSWNQIIDQSRVVADGRSNQNNEFNQMSSGANHSIATGQQYQQLRDKGSFQEESSETYSLIRERNKLLNRLEQSQNQIEELRRVVVENREVQAQYDRLIQDHLLVKISLESSERIRRQQKELINLLQHSAAVAEGTQTLGRNAALSPSSISTAAENRSWLNGFSSADSIGSKNNDYSNHIDLDLEDRFSNNVSSKIGNNELNMMNFEEPESIARIPKSVTRKAKTPSSIVKVRKGSGSSSGNSDRNINNNNNNNNTTINTNNGKSNNTSHRTNSAGNSGNKRTQPSRTIIDRQSQSGRSISINRGHTEAGMGRIKQHNISTRLDEQMANSLSSLGLTMRVEDMDDHDCKTESLSDSMLPVYHNSVQKDQSYKLTNTRTMRRQSSPKLTPSSPISLPSRSRERNISTNRDINRGRAHSADARGVYHNGIAAMSASNGHSTHADRAGSANGVRYVGESGLKIKQNREGDSGREGDLVEYNTFPSSPNNMQNRTTGRPPIPKYNQPSLLLNLPSSRSGVPSPRQSQNQNQNQSQSQSQSYSAVKAIRMRPPTFSSTQNLIFSSSAYTRASE